MQSKKHLRRGIYVGSFAIFAALFVAIARANIGWLEFPVNLYGYGGDILEASSIGVDTGASRLYSQRIFPLATSKTYMVKDTKGIRDPVAITSADKVDDFAEFDYNDSAYLLTSQASLSDWPAVEGDAKYRTQKYWAVYLTSQAFLVCNNNTYSSSIQGGRGSNSLDYVDYQAEVDAIICFDGSLPVAAQAQFTHGIRSQ